MEITISYIIIYVVEALVLWDYCNNMFYSKYSKIPELFVLGILYTLLTYITVSQENVFFNIFVFLIANCLFIFLFYKAALAIAFFHTAITAAIMGITEVLVQTLFSYFTYTFYDTESHLQNIIILATLSKLLYFFGLRCIIHFYKNSKGKNNIPDKAILLITLIPTITIWILVTFTMLGITTNLPSWLDRMITLGTILIFIINFLIFWLYDYIQKEARLQTELQIQLQKEYDTSEYYKMLVEQNESQHILIHDIKNHLQTIAVYNKQREYDKVSTYIEQIVRSADLTESARVCDNELLNIIINRYQKDCRNKNIAFHIDIRSQVGTFLSENDLTSLFSNLLDNAVEAAAGCPNAYIDLALEYKPINQLVLLTMINSCQDDPFTPDSHILVTRKKDKLHHGLGLKSVRRVVEKYHGDIQLYYDKAEKAFHAIIILRDLKNQLP